MEAKFKIGDEVICECPQKCNNSGKIVKIDYKDEVYILQVGEVFFDYARKLTKLEKALK